MSAGDFHTPSGVTEESINKKSQSCHKEEQFRREKKTEYQEQMDRWLVKVNQEVSVVCSFVEAEVVKEYYLQLGAQVPKVKLFQDEIQMRVRPIEPEA